MTNHPSASESELNLDHLEALRKIGSLITTQDNRITDQPMFIVQQRRRVYGFDTDYCDNFIWLCSEDEYNEASDEESAQLEAEFQETGRAKSGWQRTGYTDKWEFVTACFTELGCKDYLARDGHNLKDPRIYAEGSYRNDEFRIVRNALIALARRATQPVAAPTAGDALRQCIRSLAMLVAEEGIKAGSGRTMAVASDRVRAVADGVLAWGRGQWLVADIVAAALAHQPAQEQAEPVALMQALTTGIPLQEPVYINKALRAQREVRVSLAGGTGPSAAVFLVNIQMTPWTYTKEAAQAYAEGYNRALKDYRSALLDVAAPSQAAQHEAGDEIDVRYEFERWLSQRGESAVYIGDGLYATGSACDQADAFHAGFDLARAAASPVVRAQSEESVDITDEQRWAECYERSFGLSDDRGEFVTVEFRRPAGSFVSTAEEFKFAVDAAIRAAQEGGAA